MSASWDKKVNIYRASDGYLIKTLNGHTGGVLCASYSFDGQYIVSGSWDKSVKIWGAFDGKLINTLNGHADGVWSVSYSPDG